VSGGTVSGERKRIDTKTNRSAPCCAGPVRSRIRSVCEILFCSSCVGLLKINDSESDVNTIACTSGGGGGGGGGGGEPAARVQGEL